MTSSEQSDNRAALVGYYEITTLCISCAKSRDVDLCGDPIRVRDVCEAFCDVCGEVLAPEACRS